MSGGEWWWWGQCDLQRATLLLDKRALVAGRQQRLGVALAALVVVHQRQHRHKDCVVVDGRHVDLVQRLLGEHAAKVRVDAAGPAVQIAKEAERCSKPTRW